MDTTMTSAVEQKIVYLIDFNVKDIDDEGITEVELNINSIKLNASANGQSFEFESTKDNDTAKTKQFAEFHLYTIVHLA